MTTKQLTTKLAIFDIVSELDEAQARTLLAFLEVFTHDSDNAANANPDERSVDEDLLTDTSDPFAGLIGIFGYGEPSDIANHKDEYIADAIESHWK